MDMKDFTPLNKYYARVEPPESHNVSRVLGTPALLPRSSTRSYTYVYVYVYVCVYVCTCMCICMCIYIYTYMHTYTYIHIYIYIFTYIYIYREREIPVSDKLNTHPAVACVRTCNDAYAHARAKQNP